MLDAPTWSFGRPSSKTLRFCRRVANSERATVMWSRSHCSLAQQNHLTHSHSVTQSHSLLLNENGGGAAGKPADDEKEKTTGVFVLRRVVHPVVVIVVLRGHNGVQVILVERREEDGEDKRPQCMLACRICKSMRYREQRLTRKQNLMQKTSWYWHWSQSDTEAD